MGSAPSYPLEMRAQAVALYQQYLSAERAAQDLITIYGPAAPTERTVSNWCKRFRQVASKDEDAKLLDDQYRLAARSYEIIHDAYDWLDDQPGETKAKHLIQLNAVGGTAVDKIQSRNNPAVQVNILQLIAQREQLLQLPPPVVEEQPLLTETTGEIP